MTQVELARELNVTRQTVHAIETSRYTPSLPLALALGRFFDVSVEEMFDEDDRLESNDD